MDVEPNRADNHGDDEVARQRGKRLAALLSRPVPGSPTMTLGELAEQARAASPATGGSAGVQRFLAESGHSRETIAGVLGCLDLPGPEATGTAAAVAAMPVASARHERLRTLAQLQAMLLEE